MNHRENTFRAMRFERPEYIPMGFHINAACWHHYDQNALQDIREYENLLCDIADDDDRGRIVHMHSDGDGETRNLLFGTNQPEGN